MISTAYVGEVQKITAENTKRNSVYEQQLSQSILQGDNILLETFNANITQLHLDTLWKLQGNIIFLCSSEQALANLTLHQNIQFVTDRRRLCVNSQVNNGMSEIDEKCLTVISDVQRGCPYYNDKGYGVVDLTKHKVQDIEDYKHLLRTGRVCPYYYQKQLQAQSQEKSFLVGTHGDLFSEIMRVPRFKKHLVNSILFIDDCQYFSQQLELATSPTIDMLSLKQLAWEIIGIKSSLPGWQSRFYSKNKLEIPNGTPVNPLELTTQQYELAAPIISFIHKFKIDGEFKTLQQIPGSYVVKSAHQTHQIITKCTENSDNLDLYKFCTEAGFNIQNTTMQNQYNLAARRYSHGIDQQNFREYLENLSRYFETSASKLYQAWNDFVTRAFLIQESSPPQQEPEPESESNFLLTIFSPQHNTISLDESMQKSADQDETNYKLIIVSDGTNTTLKLQSLNPQTAIKLLQQYGVKQIILSAKMLYPMKLSVFELGLKFETKITYGQQIAQPTIQIGILSAGLDRQKFELQKVLDQRTKASESRQEPSSLLDIQYNNLVMQVGQTLVELNKQGQAMLVLFTSKHIMKHCQTVWSKQHLMTQLSSERSLNWLESTKKTVLYESLKLFINRTQNCTSEAIPIPSIYAQLNPQLIRTLNDTMQAIIKANEICSPIFQKKIAITCVVIGVPWANSALYMDENQMMQQLQYELKVKWIKQQQSKLDMKTFALVNAVRTMGSLISLLMSLKDVTMVLMDEQFTWKHLWKHLDQLNIKVWQDPHELIKQLNQARNQNSIQTLPPTLKNQDLNPNSGRKRKLMLNKVLLKDRYIEKPNSTTKLKQQDQPSTLDNLFKDTPSRSKGSQRDRKNSISPHRDNQCVICWSNTDQSLYKSSHCGHLACLECWKSWLETKLECPICRQRVREKFLEKFIQS